MSVIRAVAVTLPALIAVGCSCQQEPDFGFPEPPDDDVRTFTSEEIGDIGSWLSFDVSPEGQRLTMAYYSRQFGALGYAVGSRSNDGWVWAHEKVDGWPDNVGLDPGDIGLYASQRTAPDGTVWVAYRDAKANALRVAHRLGGSVWEEPVQVDAGAGSSPDAGHWASLALGTDGHPIVAHCDNGSATVRVARFDGTAWSVAEAYKSTDVTVPGADTGAGDQVFPAGVGYTDLVVFDGTEYLAFYDAAEGSLHLLEGSDGSWSDTVVDDAGDVGQWPSLWTDGSEVVIAYHDVLEQDLKVATRSGGSWSIEVVDSGEFRGADTDVFQKDGLLHVLYFDGHDNDQWLAVRDGGWSTERLGADGLAVGFHNEAVQVAGGWWVGSYDFTNRGLHIQDLP